MILDNSIYFYSSLNFTLLIKSMLIYDSWCSASFFALINFCYEALSQTCEPDEMKRQDNTFSKGYFVGGMRGGQWDDLD